MIYIIRESNIEKMAKVLPREERFLIRDRPYGSTDVENVLRKGGIAIETICWGREFAVSVMLARRRVVSYSNSQLENRAHCNVNV